MPAKKVMTANEEEGSRKSVRYIALSTLAHLGLLTMIAAMPRPQIGSAGQPNANATGSTVMMDIADPDAADSAKLGNGGEKEAPAMQTALEAQANANEASALNTVPVQAETSPITPPVIEEIPAPPAPVEKAVEQPVKKAVVAALPTKAPKAPTSLPVHASKAAKKSSSKIATQLPTKAGAAPVTEQEESLPEAVTWKATERAHEAALAQQAAEQLAADNAEEAAQVAQANEQARARENSQENSQERAQAVSAAADTAASDQAAAAANTRRQGVAAIPITTQQFASAPSQGSTGASDGALAGGSSKGAAQLGAPSGTQFKNAEEMAEQRGNKMPAYPMQDRVNGHQGVVVLVGQVAQDGHVAKATVQKSSGSIAMDQASMTAFRNWKFAPGQEGYVYKSFRFNLTGEAQEVPARLAQ